MPATKTKKKGKSGSGKASGGGEPLLSREQQEDLLALGLLALSLFILLALLPVTLLGERGGELFPSGNAMGPVGATLAALLVAGLGVSAFLVPVLGLLGAVAVGRWGSQVWAARLAALT
ncbi:MAG: hypothetical protein KY453_09525, partial [Gemmatimonadetes bacterium]|nr:hypothetical protein [Gemmatimonadota bacterium]